METKFNIGELDTLVKVQSCVIGTGSRGQKTYTFTDHSSVWAKVEQNADESIVNGNLEQGQSLQVTIYKIDGLTTRWRIVIDGVAYKISSIDNISRFSRFCTLGLNTLD